MTGKSASPAIQAVSVVWFYADGTKFTVIIGGSVFGGTDFTDVAVIVGFMNEFPTFLAEFVGFLVWREFEEAKINKKLSQFLDECGSSSINNVKFLNSFTQGNLYGFIKYIIPILPILLKIQSQIIPRDKISVKLPLIYIRENSHRRSLFSILGIFIVTPVIDVIYVVVDHLDFRHKF